MLKSLAFAIVFFGFVDSAHAQVPRDGSQQQQQPKDKGETTQTAKQPSVRPLQAENQPAKDANNAENEPYKWRDLYAPANMPNWILCVVGATAGFLAWRTLSAIQVQAGHMERQTGLIESQANLLKQQAGLMATQTAMQKASLTQWVDIQPIGVLVGTTSKSDPPDEVSLKLRWNLLNNTALPFTVQGIEIHILKGPTEEINVVEEVEVIPPAREGSRNFYPFFVETDLNKSETREFFKEGILMTVQIEISYVDAAGEQRDRFFGDHYFCKKNMLTLGGESLGKNPHKTIEKDDRPSTIRTGPERYIEWTEEEDAPPDVASPN